jgi:hypothetical protein
MISGAPTETLWLRARAVSTQITQLQVRGNFLIPLH